MPIATPEVYADMIRRAKEGGFAYPAINCTSSETVNAALRGFADAGSDGIIQFSTGGAEFGSGTRVKDMVTGAVALAEFAHVVAEKYPVQHRAAHRPLPEGQARRLRPPADRAVQGPRGRRPGAAVPVAHVGRLGDRADREPGDRRRSSSRSAPRPRSCSSWRSASSAARRTASPTRSTRSSTPPTATSCATAEALGLGREGRLPAGRHLRQRARRLQAGQRQAAPGDPQAGSGRRRQASSALARTSRSTWSSTAAPARRWRRSARRSPTAS